LQNADFGTIIRRNHPVRAQIGIERAGILDIESGLK
jgi:hypothetical protein